jgi:hypothetical protein
MYMQKSLLKVRQGNNAGTEKKKIKHIKEIRKPFYLVLIRSSLAKHLVIKKQPASSKWPETHTIT